MSPKSRKQLLAIKGNFKISHEHHSCVEKEEKLSESRLSDHLRFRINIVFRYSYVRWIFPHFLDRRKKLKCVEISIDSSSELMASVPNTDKKTGDINNVKNFEVLPCMQIQIWPIRGLSVQYVLLFRAAHDFTSWPSG